MIPAAALAVIAAAHEDARRRGASTRSAAAWALAALARDGWTTTPTEAVPRSLVACYVPPVGDIPPTGDLSRTTEPCAVTAQTAGGPMATTAERLAARTIPGPITLRHGAPGPCQIWTGALNDSGYGRIWHNGRAALVHRVAWELENGPIPPGLELDHRCGIRACWNTDHTEPVDHRTNILRSTNHVAARAAQTHCCNGHAFTADNTRRRANGTRECRACRTTRRTATPERQAA